MFYKIDHVDVEPVSQTLHGEPLFKAKVSGECSLSSWQMIIHFTKQADLLEEKMYPIFGCKQYNKSNYLQCVKLSSRDQSVACPIVTEHFAEIRMQVMMFLIEHCFIDKQVIRDKPNSLFNQALDAIEIK